jgi:hypothetical protein
MYIFLIFNPYSSIMEDLLYVTTLQMRKLRVPRTKIRMQWTWLWVVALSLLLISMLSLSAVSPSTQCPLFLTPYRPGSFIIHVFVPAFPSAFTSLIAWQILSLQDTGAIFVLKLFLILIDTVNHALIAF